MATERKTLTQLSVPICLETLFYMLSGMVDGKMFRKILNVHYVMLEKMSFQKLNRSLIFC